MAEDATVERWGLAALALGVVLALASPFLMDLGYDASAYVATGHGWARTGELVLAWGDVLTFAPAEEGHSHHFPPAYPLYLGVVFEVFGYGLWQAKWASVASALAALAVVYACTRDLYGRTAGAVVAGAVALTPQVLWVTGMGLSEPLALLLFTLTMWAILRSLDDERFIVLGGAFAGLAYLSRSSMGAFFLIAGVGGAAWRVAHRGWRGIARPWYALAILVFGLIVLAWAWRNVALFGWPNWETSPGVRGVPRWIWEHKAAYAGSLLVRAPLLAAVGAPFLLAFLPQARASLRRLRDERVSALWLAVVLVWLLGLVFSAAYLSMGPSWYEITRLDNMRYVLVGIVPLLWALAREATWTREERRRGLALGLALLVGCAAVAAYPPRYLPAQGGAFLDGHLREGDVVLVSGVGKYAFYAYLARPHDIDVVVDGHGGEGLDPEFVLATYEGSTWEGYVRVFSASQRHPFWLSPDDHVDVFARADVAAERGLAAR